MLAINPSSLVPVGELEALLKRYGRARYQIDKGMLQADIDKLAGLLAGKARMPANNRKNCLSTLKHLEHMKKLLDSDNSLTLTFKAKTNNGGYGGCRVVSEPFDMVKVAEFKVQTTDYILLEYESIVTLDFKQALNCLAFELGSDDIGYSWEDCEKLFSRFGIIQNNQACDLDFIDSDEYQKGKNMRIGSSPYQMDGCTMGDYFGNAVGQSKVYYDAMVSTARTTGCIVLNSLLGKMNKAKLTGVRVAAVYEDSILMTVNNEYTNTVKELMSESLVVTVKGRRFEVVPEVQC